MLFRKRNGTDVRKSLSACRDDLAALRRDARELATGVSEVTRTSATRAAKQAGGAYDYVSKQIASRPRFDVATVAREQRLAIVAAFAGAGAIIGALLTRR
ncbi:MAG TPA: hypothetical protein VMD53_08725 [Rhizomicrobium sp.]|nr:hypothetical protein [Rhizomicrobium sp.]